MSRVTLASPLPCSPRARGQKVFVHLKIQGNEGAPTRTRAQIQTLIHALDRQPQGAKNLHFWLHGGYMRQKTTPMQTTDKKKAPATSRCKCLFSLLFWRRERDSNPRYRRTCMPDFESGAFDHSATSPWTVQHGCAGQASHFTSDPAFLEERAAISALNPQTCGTSTSTPPI